jgi:hypothetical protein
MNPALKKYLDSGFVMWLYIIKNLNCADKVLRLLVICYRICHSVAAFSTSDLSSFPPPPPLRLPFRSQSLPASPQ